MKLKLGQIVGINESLNSLLNQQMNYKLAYKINRLKTNLEPFITAAENSRLGLVKELADENGNQVSPDNLQEFYIKYNDLLSVEENLDLQPISLNDFEGMEVSPKFFIAMGELITE